MILRTTAKLADRANHAQRRDAAFAPVGHDFHKEPRIVLRTLFRQKRLWCFFHPARGRRRPARHDHYRRALVGR